MNVVQVRLEIISLEIWEREYELISQLLAIKLQEIGRNHLLELIAFRTINNLLEVIFIGRTTFVPLALEAFREVLTLALRKTYPLQCCVIGSTFKVKIVDDEQLSPELYSVISNMRIPGIPV